MPGVSQIMKNGLGTVQSAIFFGATSDICGEIIDSLSQRGLSIAVLCGRSMNELDVQAAVLRKSFPFLQVEVMYFDASDTAGAERTVAHATSMVGDIDLAVLAHGQLDDEHLGLIDPSAGIKTADINFTSNIALGLALAHQFRKQAHGTIIFISSVAGVRVRRSLAVYGAAKRGADSFFCALDHFLGEFNSRAIVVRPGFVKTKMTRSHTVPPFAVESDAVAKAIMAALDLGQQIVWVPRSLRYVFLAMTHLPERFWRVLNRRQLESKWSAKKN